MKNLTVDGARYLLSLLSNSVKPLDTLWIALPVMPVSSTSTGADIVEPNAVGYARAPLDNVSDSWSLYGTTLSNTNQIAFPVAEASWGSIWGWALCGDATSGIILASGSLETPMQIAAGDQITIPAGAISFNYPIDRWTL